VAEATVEDASSTSGFVSPLDTILETVKTIYNSKTQIRKAHYETIKENINDMKNKIIDFLLPLVNQPPRSDANGNMNVNPQPTFQPSYAQVTKTAAPKQKSVNVILKTGLKSEVEPKKVFDYEKSVAESLMKSNIKATIQGTLPTKNGDIVMKFDKNDDVATIAKHISEKLNIKTHGRGLLLPKIKITHIPEYVTKDPDELAKVIVNSNEWLKDLTRNGNSFIVLFTYKVKDLFTAVCKISPVIRHRLLLEDKRIRVGMRSCPISDRIHLTKCGKCLKYGHKTATCRTDSYTCSWCSGDHETSGCTEKENTSAHKCTNCTRSDEQSVNHAAHSSSCPTFFKERERMRNRTDWGEDLPPRD
jgi:hypothetical protein